jgi:SAM-dependent methyltransferase
VTVVYDPAQQWERYGEVDPYFGVLSAPAFHRGRLDTVARERFFATGRQYVAELIETVNAHAGSGFRPQRALDFGCGVGRLTLPLAERCEHVYGIDVSPSMLREANCNAERLQVNNVEWIPAGRLAELSGEYDFVHSYLVFQHIPVREGERLFAMLVEGLRKGGVGVIHVTLRPGHPLMGWFHWTMKTVPFAYNAFNLARGRSWSYPHMQMNTYSLNRLGRLLAAGGITEWHVDFSPASARIAYDGAVISFRKQP